LPNADFGDANLVTIHIVGAGVTGLSAAVKLCDTGTDVVVHETAPQAGGRCRSWLDPMLDATIDNGTHVIVGANHAVTSFAAAIGSTDDLHWFVGGASFRDLDDGTTWTVARATDALRLAHCWGGSPWREGVGALRLGCASAATTIEACLPSRSVLAHRFWRPLARAVMNTDPKIASAGPFARVLRRTLARGASAMRVGIARRSLSACFIDPALALLRQSGIAVRFGTRLRAIDHAGERITKLHFGAAEIVVLPNDRVILALAPWDLARCLPDLAPELAASAIVNLHAVLPTALAPREPRLLGLIGGTAEWLVVRGNVVSATVSAADQLTACDPSTIAALLWRDIARALDLPTDVPSRLRIVKEHRATPLQTPAFERRRPGVTTRFGNLTLAGDWVEPGLPCTLEAAIASGVRAAEFGHARI